jgi:peptidyl-dipeptidase A
VRERGRAGWRRHHAVDLEKTHFGIFFGDNTGLIAGCRYLAEMLDHAERGQDAREMSKLAGELEERLNRCSVYGSKEAGARLNAMLELGRSKPWPEALKAMTGTDKADASAIIEYFQPLMDWLKEQNKGEKEGWTLPADPLK